LDIGSLNGAHTTTEWFHEGSLLLSNTSWNRKRNAFDMRGRNPDKLGKAAWVEVCLPKLRTHRNVPMTTVMTTETGNVVGHYHSIAYFEFRHITPDLDHLAGNLVTKDGGLFQALKADLVNIGKANSTGFDLKQQIPILKRRPGDFSNLGLMVLRNERFHVGR